MFWMALIAIVMGVSLASCSKDENDFSDEKKIVKLIETWEYEGEIENPEVWDLQYDDMGRLIKVTEEDWSISYLWEKDYISSEYSNLEITLENGLIKNLNIWDLAYTFKYNKSNRVVEIEEDGEQETLIWDNDKLIQIHSKTGYCEISYNGTCKKGYSPAIGIILDNQELWWEYLILPELIGARTTQLPASYTFFSNNEVYLEATFAYEFTTEGYISKIIVNYDEGEEICTYSLTWE